MGWTTGTQAALVANAGETPCELSRDKVSRPVRLMNHRGMQASHVQQRRQACLCHKAWAAAPRQPVAFTVPWVNPIMHPGRDAVGPLGALAGRRVSQPLELVLWHAAGGLPGMVKALAPNRWPRWRVSARDESACMSLCV